MLAAWELQEVDIEQKQHWVHTGPCCVQCLGPQWSLAKRASWPWAQPTGLEAGRPSHPKSQGPDLCQRAEMVLETNAQAKAQQQEGLGRLLGSLENQALPTIELQWAQTKQNWRGEGRENNSLSQNYMSPWNSGVLALSTPQGKIHLRSFKWAHVSLGPSLSARVKPVSLWNRGPSPFLPPPPDSLGLVRSRSVLGVLRLRKSPGQKNRPVQNPDFTGTCAGEIPPIF